MRRISFIKHALRKEPGQEYINRLIYTSPRAHKPRRACAIARARHVAPTAAQHNNVANFAAASSSSTVLRRGGGAGGCGAGGCTGGTHHSAAATVLARSDVTRRNGFNLGPRFRPTDICVCAPAVGNIYMTRLSRPLRREERDFPRAAAGGPGRPAAYG